MTEEVPGYSALEPVGRGGFSVVYRARQDDLDRVVALKVLLLDGRSRGDLRRFQRECRVLGRLGGHHHIVTVFDTGVTRSGRPFIAMEYFEHGSLHDRLAAEGPLPVEEVLRSGVKIAGALAAAHEAGVVHRDVKPQNILVSRYGEPALADFGIAALVDAVDVSAGSDQFTAQHVAPEVLEGNRPGVAADVYGLGSTLYTLLAGRPPHQRRKEEGIASLLLRILNEEPPEIARPDLPPAVAAAVRRAMARRPEDRFPDARALAGRLRELQSELGLPVTEVPGAERSASAPSLSRRGRPGDAAAPPDPELTLPRPGTAITAAVRKAQPRRGRRLLAGGAAAAAGACLALGLVLHAVAGGPGPADGPRRHPPPSPAPTLPAGLLAAARPTGVSGTDGGATVVLHWEPGRAGAYPVVIQRSSPGSRTPVLTALPDGATTATIGGLDPGAGYCFQVGAVVAVGRPTTVAWSAPACIRGAVAQPAAGP